MSPASGSIKFEDRLAAIFSDSSDDTGNDTGAVAAGSKPGDSLEATGCAELVPVPAAAAASSSAAVAGVIQGRQGPPSAVAAASSPSSASAVAPPAPVAPLPASRQRGSGGDPRSSLFDETTIFIGAFALVRRVQSGIESYYVNCACHSYRNDQAGPWHRCSKSMQTNQPDRRTVICRLRWWIHQGDLPKSDCKLQVDLQVLAG